VAVRQSYEPLEIAKEERRPIEEDSLRADDGNRRECGRNLIPRAGLNMVQIQTEPPSRAFKCRAIDVDARKPGIDKRADPLKSRNQFLEEREIFSGDLRSGSQDRPVTSPPGRDSWRPDLVEQGRFDRPSQSEWSG